MRVFCDFILILSASNLRQETITHFTYLKIGKAESGAGRTVPLTMLDSRQEMAANALLATVDLFLNAKALARTLKRSQNSP